MLAPILSHADDCIFLFRSKYLSLAAIYRSKYESTRRGRELLRRTQKWSITPYDPGSTVCAKMVVSFTVTEPAEYPVPADEPRKKVVRMRVKDGRSDGEQQTKEGQAGVVVAAVAHAAHSVHGALA
jgi:hypothetical protein